VTTPAPLARYREHHQKADLGNKEADVLKKTSASIGLVIAAAAGAPLTSSPAYAHASMLRGRHSHHSYSHRSHHRNHNWNRNRHRGRIFIRIYVYNKNNNHAVALARPERRETRPASLVEDGPFFGPTARRAVTRQDATPAGRDFAGPSQVDTGTVPGT
jgi:hypothetical protein